VGLFLPRWRWRWRWRRLLPYTSNMLDHVGLHVSDFTKAKDFYRKALGAIGYQLIAQFPAEETGTTAVAGFGEPPKPDFWIHAAAHGARTAPAAHIAFRVPTQKLVDEFHAAAIAAGGKDNGAPGPRPHYHADYYGAFVLDPDGNNIEAVCHEG
jgi:catechol 2,3-dioxygenase-like lactoylglutathione lyase family enzyme